MPSYPALTTHLSEAGTDGYLLDTGGGDNDRYYLSGCDFTTLYDGEAVRVLVPDLEYARVKGDSDADSIHRFSTYDYGDQVVEHGRAKARALTVAAFLEECGIDAVSVPVSFPNGVADVLRSHAIGVVTDFEDSVGGVRATKTDEEVDRITTTQRAAERAMALAAALLDDATVEEGVLVLGGEVLTSERVRRAIRVKLLEDGFGLDECIVASGAEGAIGHAPGSGPIEADEPVVVDVAPRDEESRYYADMTRTFVRGDPDPTVREWYDVVQEAYDVALEAIEPGVTGEAVNDAVCDVFERRGYRTLRVDETTDDGFTHATGHGVGLDLHERPSLVWGGGELQPGNVLAVEPGLYERGTGGVRLEDLVVVTRTGNRTLTDYPRELRVL